MSSDMPRYDHAVVLGASMAGLVTAQALTSHFRHVTILERDELPETPAPRPGVPQGRHLHALLPGGLAALDRLSPATEQVSPPRARCRSAFPKTSPG